MSNYEIWQAERYGNILPGPILLPSEPGDIPDTTEGWQQIQQQKQLEP